MRPSLVLLTCLACSAPKVDPPRVQPSAKHLTLECPDHAVGALDSSRGLIAAEKLECTAHVADLTGAALEGIEVKFFAEAGHVLITGKTSTAGTLSAQYETAEPRPEETDPQTFTSTLINDDIHTGQPLVPSWMEPNKWTSNPLSTLATGIPALSATNLLEPRRRDPLRRTLSGMQILNNPRDNLVTLIAVVTGDESFDDQNGNGKFDADEPFVDLTEPFVDANDDGTWDPSELFIDNNGDETWTSKNGRFDQNVKVWAQERILWTGEPAVEDANAPEPTTLLFPNGLSLACPNPAAGSPCTQAAPVTVSAFVADPWFNAPARRGAADGCVLATTDPAAPVSMHVVEPPGAKLSYPAGDLTSVVVSDVRDPADAGTPVRSPAAPFQRTLNCSYSSSGHVVQVDFMVQGAIQ